MAISSLTATESRNGFTCVTRMEVVNELVQFYYETKKLITLFEVISRLSRHPQSSPDDQVLELVAMGVEIADSLVNEADALRERAEKAGLIGELVAIGDAA